MMQNQILTADSKTKHDKKEEEEEEEETCFIFNQTLYQMSQQNAHESKENPELF